MRYPIIAAVIALIALAVVPAVYNGLGVEGDSRGASASLATPPTQVAESSSGSRPRARPSSTRRPA